MPLQEFSKMLPDIRFLANILDDTPAFQYTHSMDCLLSWAAQHHF